jgi:hypothetical protein
MAVHRIEKAGAKRTACTETVAKLSPTEGTATDPARVTCPLCR